MRRSRKTSRPPVAPGCGNVELSRLSARVDRVPSCQCLAYRCLHEGHSALESASSSITARRKPDLRTPFGTSMGLEVLGQVRHVAPIVGKGGPHDGRLVLPVVFGIGG